MALPLRILFIAHGTAAAAAGVLLIAAPGLIPAMVSISLEPEQFLLPYLLGAMELGVAALSIGAAWLADTAAVRLIAVSFAVLHAVSALVEVLALAQGADPLLWGNVAVRVVVAMVFAVVAARSKPRRGRGERYGR
jgi:hypothetical protein